MNIKPILAEIGAIALLSLAACGSTGYSAGAGSTLPAPQTPQSMASWYNTIGLPEINTVNRDIETVGNDQNYGQDPMSDAEQLVTDAQAGLVNLPPVDAYDWTGWLKDVILLGQAAEAGGYMNPDVALPGQQYSRAFAAAVASATGSGSPSAPAAAPAATNTCPSLDSAGYCPGADPSVTPSTQAPAPAPVASTPSVTRVPPVFACGISPTAGGDVGPTSGDGTGYTSAVVRVTVLNSQGSAIQTLTLTLTSTETSANGGTPWNEVIDPNGEPGAASCTVTVESASLLAMAAHGPLWGATRLHS